MSDHGKTKQQLIDELGELRQRVAVLEGAQKDQVETNGGFQPGASTWHSLVANTPLFVLILDRDYRIRFVNHTDSGATPDQIVGKPLDAFSRPEDQTRIRQCVQRVFETGRPEVCEGLASRLDDEAHWYTSHFAPIFEDERVAAVSVISINVTDRKRAEEALREAKDFSEGLHQSMQDGLSVLDKNCVHIDVNDAFCRMTGFSREELVGVGPPHPYWPPEAHAEIEASLKASTRGTMTPAELTFMRKNGERFTVSVSPGYVKDKQGNVVNHFGTFKDITERKRAEEALKKAHDELEQKVKERTSELAIFQRFAEASGQGFGMADLDGYITYWNPTLCRMFGEDNPEDAVGKHVTSYYPDEYFEKRQNEILPAVLRDGQWQGELVVYSHQGKATPILQNAFLVRDEKGNPVRLAAAITDITERKRAEEELRQSEESLRQSERRFRNYFEQGLIGMAVTSVDKRWLEVNDRLCQILGYPREELLQTDWVSLSHPDDVEPNLRLFNPLLAGKIEHFTLDKRYIKKDGSVVCTTIYTRAFRKDDGTIDHIVTLIEDITARRLAEEALRESEAKLKTLFQIVPVGISLLDEHRHIVDLNPALEQILGMTREAFLKDDYVRRQYLRSDGSPLPSAEFPSVIAMNQGAVVSNVDVGIVKEDGTTAWVSVSAAPLPVRGMGVAVVTMDITERHKAQEALEREQQSLWKMLQASDHERQIISYEIHDGLAQYLAAAGMQFQAYESLRGNSPEEAKKAYETAVELVRQAHFESRRLINEVRPPVIDEIGLETAISHLVHEQRRHGGPKIECRSDVQFGRLPPILENALYRIVQEALTNACKHSQSKRVTVSLAQESQEIRVEVQDWGVGFKLESVEKGHFGLEGIRQRVRLLGGRLTVESSPDSGTRVQAVVPLMERLSGGYQPVEMDK